MRVFGWGLVLMLFVISAMSAYTAVGLYGQGRLPARRKSELLGRRQLVVEARKWTASTNGAIELTVCVAAGAAGLGILSAGVMAARTPQRLGGTHGECVDCGRPIQSGTLCETCETS